MRFTLLRPRVVNAGHGHGAYLGGYCQWECREVDAYALLADRVSEDPLMSLVESPVLVDSDDYSFTEGAGLLISRGRLPALGS